MSGNKEIRFITPDYKELFRIPDGGSIVVTRPEGEQYIGICKGENMKVNAMTEAFEEVTILGKPALFTCLRIDRASIPYGYHAYDVHHDDDCKGDPAQLGRYIWVNHWGALITRDEIKLQRDGYLAIGPEDLIYCTGACRCMKDFMEQYPAKTRPPVSCER